MNTKLRDLAAKWESTRFKIDNPSTPEAEAERLTDELLSIERQIAAEPAHSVYELNRKAMVLGHYADDDGTPERLMASIDADPDRPAGVFGSGIA